MSEQEYPVPPATFEFLIVSLKAQAEMYLGMHHFGTEGKERPEPDFRVARHTIDLLAMLQEKTRGNVTMEEQRLIENALTELRFRFVQTLESRKAADGTPSLSDTAPVSDTASVPDTASVREPTAGEEQTGA